MEQLHPPASGEPDLAALYAHPPGVRLGMVASVDGSAAVEGSSRPLSGPADLRVFGVLRRQADVVLVGAGTARSEGYRPVRVSDEDRAARQARGQAPVPRVAVLTRGRGLDVESPLLAPGSGVLLLTTSPVDAPAHVETVLVRDTDGALTALRERGLTRVLCEGGPALNGALLEAGLVDEVCATTSPLLVGGAGPRLVVGAPETAVPLELLSLLHEDGVLLGRWRVRR